MGNVLYDDECGWDQLPNGPSRQRSWAQEGVPQKVSLWAYPSGAAEKEPEEAWDFIQPLNASEEV